MWCCGGGKFEQRKGESQKLKLAQALVLDHVLKNRPERPPPTPARSARSRHYSRLEKSSDIEVLNTASVIADTLLCTHLENS